MPLQDALTLLGGTMATACVFGMVWGILWYIVDKRIDSK